MKLVKASLKQDIELDQIELAQCCPEYLQHVKSDPTYKNITVDLDIFVHECINCRYCHKSFGIVHGVWDVNHKWLIPLFLLDLDEGLVN